jgi:hypothetical protein
VVLRKETMTSHRQSGHSEISWILVFDRAFIFISKVKKPAYNCYVSTGPDLFCKGDRQSGSAGTYYYK